MERLVLDPDGVDLRISRVLATGLWAWVLCDKRNKGWRVKEGVAISAEAALAAAREAAGILETQDEKGTTQ